MRSTGMVILIVVAVGLWLIWTLGPSFAGSNPMVGEAGFWLGLWHGLIILFAFVISLFSDNVTIYEVHNNGTWYNLGFILGLLSALWIARELRAIKV